MIVALSLFMFALVSAAINAIFGSKYGMTYFDMIVVGIIFTPLMPLYICIQAALIDRR